MTCLRLTPRKRWPEMPGTLVHRSGPVANLAALHDALGCAAMAVVQAARGDEDSASLSLIEAHAAAGALEVHALNVVFAAITEAAHSNDQAAGRGARTPRPASDLSRLGQERTMTNTTTAASPQLPAVTCTRAFAGCPESVSAARSWVAGFFPVPAAAADAALMTSELFTNAILYSASRLPGGQVTVSVGVTGAMVRVDVVDQGAAPPCLAAPGGLGQGLALVAALADVFGADGCDCWFALRADGAR